MQDDPLSPTLFNLALQGALRCLPAGVGVTKGDKQIDYLAFADDMLLVFMSRAGL